MESVFFLGKTDSDYLKFNKRLVDSRFPMQGVRLPIVRSVAKKHKNDDAVLSMQPKTYEEVMLLGFVIAQSGGDIDTLLARIDGFLPCIDNWAVCDSFSSTLKVVAKHRQKVLEHFSPLASSSGVYYRRFLAVLLMDYYFTDEYIDIALDKLLSIQSGDYYVDMAISWGIATACAKYFDKGYMLIKKAKLSPFIRKKSISKSLESFRLKDNQKQKLRILREEIKQSQTNN